MDDILMQVCYLILVFFIVSVAGWVMEVVLKYIQYHRFINRGFLIGPYCPIYGSGAVFITLTVGAVSNFENSYGATFMVSLIVCGVLEYLVSFCMEKRFHARWWDYSEKPMNLNGRVWIGNLIWFGIGGTFIIKLVDPVLYQWVSRIPEKPLHTISAVIVVIMVTDFSVSHFVMKFIKTSVESSEADSTESISKEIRLLVSDKSILHRRIADAYPDVIYRTEKIIEKMQKVKNEVERMKQEAAKRVEDAGKKVQDQRNNITMLMEPSWEIKDQIIQKQDELISLLETQSQDEQAIMQVREDIRNRKTQLEKKKNLLH